MKLTTNSPRDYWRRRPENATTTQQRVDAAEINAARHANGLHAYNPGMLARLVGMGSAMVVREQKGRAMAGYVVADPNRSKGTLAIQDLLVKEEHQGKGIAGFLLGGLIMNVTPEAQPRFSVADYGRVLTVGDKSLVLPGLHVETTVGKLGGDDELQRFRAQRFEHGVRSIQYPDQSIIHEIFRDGQKIGDAQGTAKTNTETVHIGDNGEPYSNPIFAATAVMNGFAIRPRR